MRERQREEGYGGSNEERERSEGNGERERERGGEKGKGEETEGSRGMKGGGATERLALQRSKTQYSKRACGNQNTKFQNSA